MDLVYYVDYTYDIIDLIIQVIYALNKIYLLYKVNSFSSCLILLYFNISRGERLPEPL